MLHARPSSIRVAQEQTRELLGSKLPIKTCEECNRSYFSNLTTEVQGHVTCAECKHLLLQRLTEGVIRRRDFRQNFASFEARLVAFIIDLAIFSIPVPMLVVYTLAVLFPQRVSQDGYLDSYSVGTISLTSVILLRIIYDTIAISFFGATLGMWATRIRVIRPSGKPISVFMALDRSLWTILIYSAFSIGFFTALYDPEKQAIHDRMCATRVVYRRK